MRFKKSRIARKLWATGALVIAGSLAGAGCSSMSVDTDHDPGVNFGKYKTFYWTPTPASSQNTSPFDINARNSLTDRRIRSTLDSKLAEKGLQETTDPAKADLRLIYYARTQDKIYITNWGIGYGYGYGPWNGYFGPGDAYQYREGSLIVDFIDNHTNELVWRGVATSTVDNSMFKQDQVNEAVNDLMKEFPPKSSTA
jgi:hypothetical protein